MNKVESRVSYQPNRLARRSFLKRLGLGAALLAPGAAFLSSPRKAFGNHDEITHGDAAILRFLAAAEIIETTLAAIHRTRRSRCAVFQLRRCA